MFSFFKSDAPQPASAEKPEGWLTRLKSGLARSRAKLTGQLAGLFGRHPKIDAALYEELRDILLSADVGVGATERILEDLKARVKREQLSDSVDLKEALKATLIALLQPLESALATGGQKPFIIMFVGVNGAGKTTTIGKLAKYFQGQGKSVLLAAGDTFRAAAREQIQVWGERNGVAVITQEQGDAAAVIFDAVIAARARGIDILLADTAGRLPTQLNLMEEIKKVKRVIAKADPTGPHEILLVLDANTGQNALAQLKAL